MRIIAGEFKSRRLVAPKGANTRPTLDSTREALFNILNLSCQNAKILDLFGGSGALAIEAISRGAYRAVIADNSNDAMIAIKNNLSALKIVDRARIIKRDYKKTLSLLYEEHESFDIIFLDPPYDFDYDMLLSLDNLYNVLTKEGIIIVEHSAKKTLSLNCRIECYSQRRYGDTILSFLKRKLNGRKE